MAVGTLARLGGISSFGATTITGSGSIRKEARVTLTSANILAMNATPVSILAAPGTGKALILDSLTFSFTVGTQYANGGVVSVQYNTASVNVLSSTVAAADVNGAASFVKHFISAATASGIAVISNKALEITNATAAFITGTGTAKLVIKYRIVTV